LGNESEEIQQEVAGWNQRILLDLAGLETYTISVEDGRFTTTPGPIDEPDLVFTMNAAEAVAIFSGEKDAESAFVSGALKVTGDLLDAMKLQTLIEIVADEIEY
jgi:putative sterol carrier protein